MIHFVKLFNPYILWYQLYSRDCVNTNYNFDVQIFWLFINVLKIKIKLNGNANILFISNDSMNRISHNPNSTANVSVVYRHLPWCILPSRKSRGLGNACSPPSVPHRVGHRCCVGLFMNVDTCASGKMEQGYFCRHQSLVAGLSLWCTGWNRRKGVKQAGLPAETQHNVATTDLSLFRNFCARARFTRRGVVWRTWGYRKINSFLNPLTYNIESCSWCELRSRFERKRKLQTCESSNQILNLISLNWTLINKSYAQYFEHPKLILQSK